MQEFIRRITLLKLFEGILYIQAVINLVLVGLDLETPTLDDDAIPDRGQKPLDLLPFSRQRLVSRRPNVMLQIFTERYKTVRTQ